MKVSILITCLTDQFYPRVGQAMALVLEKLGCDIDFPAGQTCCGQPLYNAGCHQQAADLARQTLDVFALSPVVVTPSASCAAMVHEAYGKLLADDPRYFRAAGLLREKIHVFSDFLVNVLQADLRGLGCRWPGSVVCHESCHMRSLGLEDPAARLLDQIEGLERLPLARADECCGFGGAFAVKHPEISGAMAQDKVACLRASGASTLVCNDAGCAMNLTGTLHRAKVTMTTRHVAEIVAEGLGLLDHA